MRGKLSDCQHDRDVVVVIAVTVVSVVGIYFLFI